MRSSAPDLGLPDGEEPTRGTTSWAGIIRPTASQRFEAIQALVRGDADAARRFLAFAETSKLRLDGLWSRIGADGRIEATALAAINAGRTATLYSTPPGGPASVGAVAALIEAACAGASELDVDLVQAIVDPKATLELESYRRAGMTQLATLRYLERSLSRLSARLASPLADLPAFRIEEWDPSERRAMVEALERTYEGTLDCPALSGLRRGEDILEGHLQSGRFQPSLWNVARFTSGTRAGEIAGVCLMNSSPPPQAVGLPGSAGTIELVYLGTVPAARGRGLGTALLHHGLARLRGRPERSILLAVDDRNAPALALYERNGFRRTMSRVAFIRPVRRSS